MTSYESQPLEKMDREDVVIGYFGVLSEVSDLATLEISWDNGDSYSPMTLGQDRSGAPAYPLVFPGKGGVLRMGWNYGIVRVTDHPEKHTHRFAVEVR